LHEAYALERCSVETCRSVIINVHDDAETVKILLALSAYLKGKELTYPELRFIASLQDAQYVEAANIAGEGRAESIFAKDAIARIISNTFKRSPVFRIGGDEFVVILRNADLENREELFVKFDSECANTFVKTDAADVVVSVAKGFSGYDPGRDSQLADVFNRADEAMYRDKRSTKTAQL
jgi:predicted signal transduction protein with EAL and GGDEF domain